MKRPINGVSIPEHMAGRHDRKNCAFCQHPNRDDFEHKIRIGTLSVSDLDRDQSWAEGTAHRHMRRHSGEYHNSSNSECPICTHEERSVIEEAILDHRVTIDDFADELDIHPDVVSHHMEKHTKPLIQRQADIDVLPSALSTVRESLLRIEKNMNRMDNILSLHLDQLENDMMDEDEIVTLADLQVAIKMHKEVRETLNDLAKWMDKAESIDNQQSVSVLSVLQAHFAEKSPDEWRELRNSLAEAGVLEDG